MLVMCKHPAMTMLYSLHILVSMLARAAAGGAERKHFLKQVVTTPDASMVIGERFYAANPAAMQQAPAQLATLASNVVPGPSPVRPRSFLVIHMLCNM